MKYKDLNQSQQMTLMQRLSQASMNDSKQVKAFCFNYEMKHVQVNYKDNNNIWSTVIFDFESECPDNMLIPLEENEVWQMTCDDPNCCPENTP